MKRVSLQWFLKYIAEGDSAKELLVVLVKIPCFWTSSNLQCPNASSENDWEFTQIMLKIRVKDLCGNCMQI